MGRKFGGSVPFLGRERPAGSRLTQSRPRPRLTSIPCGILICAAIWPQRIWAENWGLCPFGGGEAGSPSDTMWPGPRPTRMPSFILIRQTVWPQYINVTDRQDRQDRQRSDSIGRTVLQTVAHKLSVRESGCQYRKSVTLCTREVATSDKQDHCL